MNRHLCYVFAVGNFSVHNKQWETNGDRLDGMVVGYKYDASNNW